MFEMGTEFRASPTKVSAILLRELVPPTDVIASVVDDDVVVEGDILLGSLEEVEAQYRANLIRRAADFSRSRLVHTLSREERLAYEALDAIAIREPSPPDTATLAKYRWPNATIPYQLDASLPDKRAVLDAIQHWEQQTIIQFAQRTNEPDFVDFVRSTGCSAHVGRRGGRQLIKLGSECCVGNIIHEIGHAVGLWHEQSRSDRDRFVRIRWENILPGLEHNFSQHLTDGDDVGLYDYGSIMHYPRNAFSVDPGRATVEVSNDIEIGQRVGLSVGDIDAVRALYENI